MTESIKIKFIEKKLTYNKMKDCNNNDFSPEWISNDLGVSFEDIIDVLNTVELDDSIMEEEQQVCGINLEMILSID